MDQIPRTSECQKECSSFRDFLSCLKQQQISTGNPILFVRFCDTQHSEAKTPCISLWPKEQWQVHLIKTDFTEAEVVAQADNSLAVILGLLDAPYFTIITLI